jgi:hypothetical protein
MNIQQDFEELFELLGRHKVDFMVVGGYAVAFHGFPRFTKDIDIFFRPSPDNVEKLRQALKDFGFTEEDLSPGLFDKPGNIVTFGVEPMRVDFVNRIDGVSYADAEAGRTEGRYGKARVFFIGKSDLLKNKTSTNRPQDKLDADNLA